MTEIEFTQDWWRRCLKDDAKLVKWLQKLENTEIQGFHDYMHAMSTMVCDDRNNRIFSNIANDEFKHSQLLLQIFEDRKIEPQSTNQEIASTYWKTMNAQIVDFDSFCAVNYLGESLAAFRFEVIAEMAETPSDIKQFLTIALPDEQFHRQTLKRMCSEETLVRIQAVHDEAVLALKGKK
jgi:rubrerythrin